MVSNQERVIVARVRYLYKCAGQFHPSPLFCLVPLFGPAPLFGSPYTLSCQRSYWTTPIGESYEPSSTAASCACFADCMHHILPIFWQCCSAYKYYRLLPGFCRCLRVRPAYLCTGDPRRARLWQGLSFGLLSRALWSIINNVINNSTISGHQTLNI